VADSDLKWRKMADSLSRPEKFPVSHRSAAGHLCSWAKFSPGINSSAGKTKGNGSTGHGNRYLARVLSEAAVVASRTDAFLGERYRRIARRRGKKRAVVAVGRSILVIAWHLLADEDTHFTDLGADHFTEHTNPEVKKRNHIRQLPLCQPGLRHPPTDN
jgi:transposase